MTPGCSCVPEALCEVVGVSGADQIQSIDSSSEHVDLLVRIAWWWGSQEADTGEAHRLSPWWWPGA